MSKREPQIKLSPCFVRDVATSKTVTERRITTHDEENLCPSASPQVTEPRFARGFTQLCTRPKFKKPRKKVWSAQNRINDHNDDRVQHKQGERPSTCCTSRYSAQNTQGHTQQCMHEKNRERTKKGVHNVVSNNHDRMKYKEGKDQAPAAF